MLVEFFFLPVRATIGRTEPAKVIIKISPITFRICTTANRPLSDKNRESRVKKFLAPQTRFTPPLVCSRKKAKHVANSRNKLFAAVGKS